MKVAHEEFIALAVRAEDAGQPNVAEALFAVAGRMDRTPGWDGFDADEPDHVAAIRGRQRAARMDPGPVAANHHPGEC